jgi:ABC-2 type transport system permease protein
MIGRVAALVRMELLALLQDRRGRIGLFALPLLQMLVFGYAATFDISRMPIAVFNEDHGPEGRKLAARFAASSAFEIVALPTHQSEIPRLIDRKDIAMAVHIGQRFSSDLLSDGGADVQVITDGRRLNTALALQGYAGAVIAGFSREVAAASGFAEPRAFTVTRAWYNPNLLSHWFAIPGLIGKLLLIANLTISVLAVARDRESGGLEQLRIRSFTGMQILVGKAVPPIMIGMVQGGALAIAGALWFEVPYRSCVALMGVALAALLFTSTGIGMLISTLARTQRQATLGAFLFMIPAVMLSGFAAPISSMPEWMQVVTFANPLRYFIELVRNLFLRGADWAAMEHQLWPLCLIGLVSYGAALLVLQRRAG